MLRFMGRIFRITQSWKSGQQNLEEEETTFSMVPVTEECDSHDSSVSGQLMADRRLSGTY